MSFFFIKATHCLLKRNGVAKIDVVKIKIVDGSTYCFGILPNYTCEKQSEFVRKVDMFFFQFLGDILFNVGL